MRMILKQISRRLLGRVSFSTADRCRLKSNAALRYGRLSRSSFCRPEISSDTSKLNWFEFSRKYSDGAGSELDEVLFEKVCSETLESLCEFFESLVEDNEMLKGGDVVYSDGVLTVNLGPSFGVYVINRQSPNKQIWLSSPRSGPKRYDYLPASGRWIYKHDNVSLRDLLQDEISRILDKKIKLPPL